MRFCLFLAMVASLAAECVLAQEKTTTQVTVIDAKGKEIALKSWKFTL